MKMQSKAKRKNLVTDCRKNIFLVTDCPKIRWCPSDDLSRWRIVLVTICLGAIYRVSNQKQGRSPQRQGQRYFRGIFFSNHEFLTRNTYCNRNFYAIYILSKYEICVCCVPAGPYPCKTISNMHVRIQKFLARGVYSEFFYLSRNFPRSFQVDDFFLLIKIAHMCALRCR